MNEAERLRALITELLESPHSFAIGIGLTKATTIYEVINGKRSISPSLLKKIITTYPNLNPEWLIRGTGTKLLTINKQDLIEKGTFEIVKEEPEVYEKTSRDCKNCQKKDEEIKRLLYEINSVQRELNDCRKEVLALKNAASG